MRGVDTDIGVHPPLSPETGRQLLQRDGSCYNSLDQSNALAWEDRGQSFIYCPSVVDLLKIDFCKSSNKNYGVADIKYKKLTPRLQENLCGFASWREIQKNLSSNSATPKLLLPTPYSLLPTPHSLSILSLRRCSSISNKPSTSLPTCSKQVGGAGCGS